MLDLHPALQASAAIELEHAARFVVPYVPLIGTVDVIHAIDANVDLITKWTPMS